MLLWVILAFICATAVLAVVAPVLARRSDSSGASEGARAADVFRDQLVEIENELARGVVAEADAEGARIEISRRLIQAAEADENIATVSRKPLRRAGLAAAVIGIPAVSLALYLSLGSPGLSGKPHAERAARPISEESIQGLVGRIEARLREKPNEVRGWEVIAPVYIQLRRYGDAAHAYENVIRLKGRDPAVLANRAEALVLADQGLVRAKARALFAEAGKANPKLSKPEFYLGLAERQDGKLDAALARWKALLARAPQDAPWRPLLVRHMAGLRHAMAKSGEGAGTGSAETGAPEISNEQMAAARSMSPEQRQQMIEGMVERLAARLDKDGGDLNEWLRLARVRMVLGRTEQAAEALGKAEKAFAGDEAALKRITAFRREIGLAGEQ